MRAIVWYRDSKGRMWDDSFENVDSVSEFEGGMVQIQQENKRQMIPKNAIKRLEIRENV